MRLVSESGCEGVGEIVLPPHVPIDVERLVVEVEELLRLQQKESEAQFLARLDARGVSPRVRAGLSAAWFHLNAEQRSVSLAALVSGIPDAELPSRIPVNALLVETELALLAREITQLLLEGYTTFKLKCSADRDQDLLRVSLFRSLAPDATLRLDANESWDASWALDHLRSFARFDIEYIEQPLPHGMATKDLVDFVGSSPIPIAFDEAASTPQEIDKLLDLFPSAVIILKPSRLGGPDKVWEAIKILEAHGAKGVVTNSLESPIGVRTAFECARMLPQPLPACGLGTLRFVESWKNEAPRIHQGFMAVI